MSEINFWTLKDNEIVNLDNALRATEITLKCMVCGKETTIQGIFHQKMYFRDCILSISDMDDEIRICLGCLWRKKLMGGCKCGKE